MGLAAAILDEIVHILGAATRPPSLTGQVDLNETSTPGRAAATVSAATARSTPCQAVTSGANLLTLLRWTGPRKCQRTRSGTAVALATNSWA